MTLRHLARAGATIWLNFPHSRIFASMYPDVHIRLNTKIPQATSKVNFMSKFLIVPAAFALALTLAACGGNAPDNSTAPADTTTTPAPATTPPPADTNTMAPAPEPTTPAPATP
jgi:hypothetical protein